MGGSNSSGINGSGARGVLPNARIIGRAPKLHQLSRTMSAFSPPVSPIHERLILAPGAGLGMSATLIAFVPHREREGGGQPSSRGGGGRGGGGGPFLVLEDSSDSPGHRTPGHRTPNTAAGSIPLHPRAMSPKVTPVNPPRRNRSIAPAPEIGPTAIGPRSR